MQSAILTNKTVLLNLVIFLSIGYFVSFISFHKITPCYVIYIMSIIELIISHGILTGFDIPLKKGTAKMPFVGSNGEAHYGK